LNYQNPKLKERPDHKHYPNCLSRKMAIEDFCHRFFFFTLGISIVLGVFSFWGASYTVLSWIPSIFGDPWELPFILVQLLLVIGMSVLAALGCGKRKVYLVILLGIYAAMALFGLISHTLQDFIIFAAGSLGLATGYPAVQVYLDDEQLKNTEGYPLFNVHLAEQEENAANNVPQYASKNLPETMDEAEQTDPLSFTGMDVFAEMPPLLSKKIAPIVAENILEYQPESGKHCNISDSPLKLQ